MNFEHAVQEVFYSTLNAGLSHGVYDFVSELPSGQPADKFPYVVIGEGESYPFDTDNQVGSDVDMTLHIWSKSNSMMEIKTIIGEIRALLHRATLIKTGYNIVDSLCVDTKAMTDPDGQTRHGIIRFRVTIQAD